MKAININDREAPYTDLILDGKKTIETRSCRSLHCLIGQRVGIIRTGCGKAKLVGFVTIVDVIEYHTEDHFRSDYGKHWVDRGSTYDISDHGMKYGYALDDPQRCDPVTVTAKGIVIRNI